MLKAMVLAAGVGSRLDPISHRLPKPLVPILNTPVMRHILFLLREHGVTEVISNTFHMGEVIESYFADNPVPGLNIQFFREPALTGDAGGVRAAREFLSDDTFVVIMGDLVSNANLSAIVKEHREKKAIATIATKSAEDVTRFGVIKRNSQGYVEAFQEKPKADEAISKNISTGIYVLEPAVFEHIPKDGVYGFGRQLFPSLVEKGLPVVAADLNGYWSDIGTLKDLFRANMDALYGRIPLDAIQDEAPDRYVRRDPEIPVSLKEALVAEAKRVLFGERIKCAPGLKIYDGVVVGDDVSFGEKVTVQNSVILNGANIPAGTKLRDCIFAFDSEIKIDCSALT